MHIGARFFQVIQMHNQTNERYLALNKALEILKTQNSLATKVTHIYMYNLSFGFWFEKWKCAFQASFFCSLVFCFSIVFFFSYNSFLVLKVFGMEFQYRQLQGVEGCSLFRLIEISKYVTNLWNCEAQHQFSSDWIHHAELIHNAIKSLS